MALAGRHIESSHIEQGVSKGAEEHKFSVAGPLDDIGGNEVSKPEAAVDTKNSYLP